MDQQARLWIAIALSLLLWVAWDFFVLSPYREQQAAAERAARESMPSPAPTLAPQGPSPTMPAAAGSPAPQLASATGIRAPTGGQPIEVDTPLYRAVLTPRGGRLVSFELKHHRTGVSKDSPPLELVRPGDDPILPLTVMLEPGLHDGDTSYNTDQTSFDLSEGDAAEVVLRGVSPSGAQIEKRIGFVGGSYVVSLALELADAGGASSVGVVVPQLADVGGYSYYDTDQGVALVDGVLNMHEPDAMIEQPVTETSATWAGFSGQYFAAIGFVPDGLSNAVFGSDAGEPIIRIDAPLRGGEATYQVLLGPKQRDVLEASGHDLDRVLDFGWFWFIAMPMLQLIRWVYGVVANYGVAIIVVTCLIKLVTYPLTTASMKSMKKMQAIQPQMTKLRERHKDDPAAMQQAMMELYKKHNVNPLSGCLPMILQIPIFIGLYNALLMAVELRHAPFAGWINDLSAPDRLHIAGVGVPVLTLLMGASMLLQQLMMPAQGDPNQRRMMMIMPVVFTFMFINFPSGLVLYWLVNNVLSIGQQYLTLRSST